MKTAKNLVVALIAVVMMACTFSATAAEAGAAAAAASVSAKAPKALKDMSLEELLAFLRTLTPEEVAALMGEVLNTNDIALIDMAGKAFTMLVATADEGVRDQLLASTYAANPGIVIADTGAIIANTGSAGDAAGMMMAGGMDAFTAGNNTAAGNAVLIDADVDTPEPHEPYSAGAAL